MAILVANTTQLLADDYIVESRSAGLTRSVHPPALSHVVLKPDAPWERGHAIGIVGTSVVDDGDRLRMYYMLRNATLVNNSWGPPQPDFHAKPLLTAYAESVDEGATWTKPLLHRYSLNGSTANNIIGELSDTAVGAAFIDENPNVPPERRYRAVYGFNHSFSSDGLNWSRGGHWSIPSDPLDVGDWGSGGGDTQGVAYWDGGCECYSFYTRFKNEPPRPPQWFRMHRRAQSNTLDGPSGKGNWSAFNQSLVRRAGRPRPAASVAFAPTSAPTSPS